MLEWIALDYEGFERETEGSVRLVARRIFARIEDAVLDIGRVADAAIVQAAASVTAALRAKSRTETPDEFSTQHPTRENRHNVRETPAELTNSTSSIFGFLLGSTLSGAAVYYYILEEYRVSNELLTEDIYVRLPVLAHFCSVLRYAWSSVDGMLIRNSGTGTTSRRPEDRILHPQSGGEDCGDADEAIAIVGGRELCVGDEAEVEAEEGRGRRRWSEHAQESIKAVRRLFVR